MHSQSSVHGLSSYIETSSAIAQRSRGQQPLVLGRILLTKMLSGLSAFEYGLYGLHAKPLGEVRDYLTKKQTTTLFNRVNPVGQRPKVDDKLLFHRLCRTAGIPTPDILAVLSTDGTVDGNEVVLPDFSALIRYFASDARRDVILKPRRDSLGTGVRFVSLRAGRAFDLNDQLIDTDTFARELSADMQRDQYLVQPFVRPHSQMATLSAGKALGTLRILAFSEGSEVRILYALLRIPAAGNVHDNFSSGNNGNLIAAVDPKTGRLGRAWGRSKNSSSRLLDAFACNPDNGAQIEGVQVPMWETIQGLLARAAAAFSDLPCMGWDLAVTEDRVLVIEANANADIIGAQVCCGAGARSLLRPVYARYARRLPRS